MRLLCFLISALAVICVYSQELPVISPSLKTLFIAEGDSVDLSCYHNSTTKVILEWNYPNKRIVENLVHESLQKQVPNSKINRHISKLHIQAIKPENYGKYICSYADNGKTYEQTVNIMLMGETKIEYVFNKNDEEAILSCLLDQNTTLVDWYKNDTLVTKLDDKDRYVVFTNNNTLLIKKPIRKDADLYIARFTVTGSDIPYDCKVKFSASPFVKEFEKSKNLIQDEKLELQCNVLGYPRSVVTWFKDEKQLNHTNDDRIKMAPLNGYENAKLTIKEVEFDDAGEYKCLATSSAFPNETDAQTVTVRVKDKLAAVWPFLGIVLEVIVLCTIIFIYEKRRNKQAEREENNAQEADGNGGEKKEGLRHRNTNNAAA